MTFLVTNSELLTYFTVLRYQYFPEYIFCQAFVLQFSPNKRLLLPHVTTDKINLCALTVFWKADWLIPVFKLNYKHEIYYSNKQVTNT